MNEPTLPEESLFLQALELRSSEEQSAFLDRECGANAELRSSVEALLRHHREGSRFLESPPTEVVEAGEQLTAGDSEAPALDFLAPSAEPASIGRLGQYEILEVLGSGGFGVVLKARDSKLDRIVAVKTLAQSLASSVTARRRFVREAKAAAAVKHENVVGIYHVSDDGPVPFLVMECVSGPSLEQKLHEAGMLDVAAILRIGMQVASGLAAAHQQGLVHRDVKPGNILLENGVERVKITDFGLARAANDAAITRTGDVAGTPQYMSPEQALGHSVDARSDLFSLGSVLYAMCTGRSPFRAETTIAALRRVCDDAPRPIREINPEIPEWLVAIIDRLLAKEPDERFQTADEVTELLGQHLAHVQHPSVAPLPPAPVGNALRGVPLSRERGRDPGLRNATEGVLYRSHRRRFAVAAAIVLFGLFFGISLSEATGVTHVVPTVIRIVTGEGTLVVETDPDVHVTVAGNGDLTFNLAGGQSIHVPTGDYRVKATRDGKPVPLDKNLVEVARGGRAIVKVKLEAPSTLTEQGAPAPLASGEIRRFPGHTGVVWNVAYSPDGRHALSWAGAPTVRLWDVQNGTELRRFESHPDYRGVAFSSDGRLAICGHRAGGIMLWEVASGKELNRFAEDAAPIYCMAFSPNDDQAVTGGSKGAIILWDIHTGEEVRHFEGHKDNIYSVAFSPDATQILSSGGGEFKDDVYPPDADNSVRLWDVETADELARFQHTSYVYSAVFSPDGRFGLSGSADGTMRLWDLRERKERRHFEVEGGVGAVAFTPDGRFALSGAGMNYISLWEVDTGARLQRFEGHTSAIQSLAVSPDGRSFLSGSWDATMRLWQLPEAGPERGAFVLLGGKGVAERKFDTLAEAVTGASDGDTIEIRGNGPFVSQPINIGRTALTIRAGQGFRPVIKLRLRTDAPLVLEGLELQAWGQEPPPDQPYWIVAGFGSTLHVANCRFRADLPMPVGRGGYCISTEAPSSCFVRNCEFVCPTAYPLSLSSKGHVDNCVAVTSAHVLGFSRDLLSEHDTSLQVTRNTLVSERPVLLMWLDLAEPAKLPANKLVVMPTRVEAAGNVFDGASVLQFTESTHFVENYKPLEPPEAEALLRQLLAWRERSNCYAAGATSFTRHQDPRGDLPPHGPKSLVDWERFWGSGDTDSQEGRVRFKGGNLLAKMMNTPEQLTPDDFRLRPDSPGYKAGEGGKDLGADVDLVGPGAGYERWKKTPEYQEWLKDTGQLRAESPKPETQAFVLLTGKGAEVRKFDTLAEAVSGASEGDTIEIRGNGPFLSDGVTTRNALIIRAGAGFAPSVTLSQAAADNNIPLLTTYASLVLEGLELRRIGGTEGFVEKRLPRLLAPLGSGALSVANCRLILNSYQSRGGLFSTTRKAVWVRNSELSSNASGETGWGFSSGGHCSIENCVCAFAGLGFNTLETDFADVSIRVRGNSFAGKCMGSTLFSKLNLSGNEETAPPVHLAFSDNVVLLGAAVRDLGVLHFHQYQPDPPYLAAESLLPRLVRLDERQNVYLSGTPMLSVGLNGNVIEATLARDFADWKRFWNQSDTGSVEGDIRFHGGDLVQKARTAPETLTADEFRLRPDSAGYRAGKDGKDLGADVDLVGPGAAYERWKKTPEYQEWRKITGQQQ